MLTQKRPFGFCFLTSTHQKVAKKKFDAKNTRFEANPKVKTLL